MGLGDDGLDGIRRFCEQHQCNSICHKFKLPDLSTIKIADAPDLRMAGMFNCEQARVLLSDNHDLSLDFENSGEKDENGDEIGVSLQEQWDLEICRESYK